LLFLGREEQVPARLREIPREHVEADGRVFLGGGHQDGAVGHKGQSEEHWRVAERPEQDAVELAPVFAQVGEQLRNIGAVLPEPLLFFLFG
jgi:hypothetical protein